MKGIRDGAEKQVDVVREKAREQMRAVLTEDQKPKFEAMVQKMDAARKQQQQSSGK